MTENETSTRENTEDVVTGTANSPPKEEDSLKDSLQALAAAFASSSTKQQVYAVAAVTRALKRTEEVPEGVYRGLCRMIVATSSRSLQRDSLKSLRCLVRSMDEKAHELVVKHFAEAITHIKLHPVPTTSISKGPKSVACLFAEVLLPPVQDHLKTVTAALSQLAYYVLVSKPPRAFTTKLAKFIESISLDSLVPFVVSLGESSPDLSLGGAALLFVSPSPSPPPCPSPIVALFTKHVLMAKQLPPLHLIKSARSYLSSVTLAQFNEVVLPTLKKALLRSPEVAVYGTSVLFDAISFSVDPLLGDILKPILALSISTSDDVRVESLKAVTSFAKHTAIEGLGVVHSATIAQLAAAKTPEQKAAILDTVGRLISGDIGEGDKLDGVLVSTLNTLVKATTDTNETVVRAQWNAIGSLAKKVSDKTKLDFLFKEAIKQTGVARVNALRTIASIVVETGLHTLPGGIEKSLWTEVEKGVKEPLEAVPIVLLLLETQKSSPSLTPQCSSAVKSIEMNENIIKDKNLSALTDEDATVLAQLVERITVVGKEVMPSSSLLRSLIVSLTFPSHSVRSSSLSILSRLLSIPVTGPDFAAAFARELYEALESGWIDQAVRKTWSSEEAVVPGSLLISVVSPLMIPNADYTSLAPSSLLLCAHTRIAEEDGALWLRWFHQLDDVHGAKKWLGTPETIALFEDTVFGCANRSVRNDALSMLVSAGSDELKKALWDRVEKKMIDIDIEEYRDIPEKDVAIMRAPEGVLYNTDVLDIDEAGDAKNVKRENKAYKFKEQLAELELKRELAEKRRKEGKLTPKQKEAMEKEMAKEKVIRDRTRSLYTVAESSLSEVRAMVEADGTGAMQRPQLLVQYTIPLLASHLVSKEASVVFISFVRAAFNDPEDPLQNLVAHVSLRVLGSKWTDEKWSEEGKETQLKRLMGLLVERVFVVETGDDTEEEAALLYEDSLGAPQLSVLHPLLTSLLEGERHSDGLKQQVLDMLKNAISRRLATDDSILTLPLVELSSLLLSFASSSTLPSLSTDALIVLEKLVSVVNDTGKVTPVVTEMVERCLEYLTSDKADIRESTLRVLSASQLLSRVAVLSEDSTVAASIRRRLLVARFDSVDAVSAAANQLWFASLFAVKDDLFEPLIEDISSDNSLLRESACQALVLYLEELPSEVARTISKLDEVYHELRELKGVEVDTVGRIRKEAVDRWEPRLGVCRAVLVVAEAVPEELAMNIIKLLVPDGLDDRNEACRDMMTSVGVTVVSSHGGKLVGQLLPLLEDRLTKLPDGQTYDNLRQGLVVLLGTLAKYVDDDEKVNPIVRRLVEALSTPSQKVQEAVSTCLSPLVPKLPNAYELLVNMESVLFEGSSYGQRRGAAYGLAGLVKGLGISAIRENNFIATIENALVDKSPQRKQGALLALEMLSSTVGKLFEPYLIQCLPGLLLCFGDNDESVRSAAQDAARAAMRSLTAHGTKCILPKVLDALDNDSWRTKCAAVDLLGAMAFCAPRQLSSCLPTIVPKLIEVLADSHSKVRGAGERALKKIGSVIQNPEVLGVSNQIMQGLIDPATKTSFSLNTIVNTKFIHYIDAASLALIMPIVRRAFEDRNSETRRLAAQIISNIYKLSEDKDMEPYLADMVPGLQKALMDPVPEIRTVAAKALGAVVARSKGETGRKLHSTIIPWLKDKLVSEASTVDRSGAAQGLSEVLAGVGTDQLDYVMPEIIQATESTQVSAETRDGYILMYIYLPMVFGDRFTPYLPRVIPSILKALADENEYVRASALKAGQRLIGQFVSHARKMLLPQLQAALYDENWRIRHAGVQLIGDFLFNISGISGKSTSSTGDEDDTMGMEHAGKTIVRALGQKCRDEVLAGLYLVRSDVSLTVRQGASHVWKMVVSNTPRTLKELMKTLFEKVLESLASSCEDRQQTGARCLGELVRKMGEKIILEVLPVLDEYLESEDVEKRVGVAVALHEIIDNMGKEVLFHYMSQIVVPLRRALEDKDEQVRTAAADTFHVFHNMVGPDAYEEVVGPLLDKLTDERDATLDGLAEVMQRNSRTMLPYILPRLTRKPVKVNALCTLAAASGDSLGRQLSKILDSLLAAAEKNDQYEPMIEPCEEVVLSVTDEEGISSLLEYVFHKAKDGNVPSAVLLHTFIEKTSVDLEEYSEQIISGCLQLYATTNEQIADHSVLALLAYSKKMDATQQMDAIPLARKLIGNLSLNSRGKQLLGFAHPKSLFALVAFFREGVLQGSVDTKATSSEALGLLVSLSTAEAVKPHVVNVTGPLIRVLGDRFPPNVKQAILSCLSQLLDKVDAMLRPFLPQLQSTFLKSLQDGTSRPVRLASAGALSRLVRLSPKPEPMLSEMLKTVAASADKQLLETTLVAARVVIANAAPNALSTGLLHDGFKTSQSCISGEGQGDLDDSITSCAGALAGQIALRVGDELIKTLLNDATSPSLSPRRRVFSSVALQEMCKSSLPSLSSLDSSLRQSLTSCLQGDVGVAIAAARAAAYVLISEGWKVDSSLLSSLGRAINHQSIEVRRVVGVVLAHYFASLDEPLDTVTLKTVVPQLVNGTKESNSAVRCAAELALVYAFQLQKGQQTYEEYSKGFDGAAKNVLTETHKTLSRVVRSGDLAIDPLDNILATN